MSRENCEESAYVIDKLAKLLAEIAVIVNGPEPPLTSWSYHDLPEKVRALKEAPPAAVPARGYVDKDRQRIVSAMQSMYDRLGGFLVNTCGDAFDGDIDTMLEAINFMKALRIDALTVVPARKSPPVPHADHEDCNCVQVGYADGWNACRAAMTAVNKENNNG